ncbi:HEM14 [Candida margitis]|uniref:HEM14 n=1 Tax=Candida margitis TaxID=1775924 RepID=UPI0022277D6A|nr:HEM14 [Candida margitis]KAI5968656.1 HEM14 [Candida margitis]
MSLPALPKNGKVAVLGAGISGLTFTYFLSRLRPDISFQIFEKSIRPGGWMNSPHLYVSDTKESILLEKGPRTLRGVKNGSLFMIDILRNLNLQDQVEVIHKSSKANRKYITDAQGEIVQVPNSFATAVDFFKRVKVVDGKLIKGLLKEPFVKPLAEDETVEQFFKRRLGSTSLTDNVASAIIHGVYAGDIGKLSIKSVMPFLKDVESQSGSIVKHILKSLTRKNTKKEEKDVSEFSSELQLYEKLISPQANLLALQNNLKAFPMIKFRDGMETLPKNLANYLVNNTNTKIHYGTPVQQCDPKTGKVNEQQFDHIRSTINTHALAQALPLNNPLIPELKAVQYVTVFLTNVYTKKPILLPKDKSGFGFLRPRHRNIDSNPQALLGTIYDSDVENHAESLFSEARATPGEYNKITIMMGGHYYSNWNIPSNKLNLKIVKDVLQEKLNVNLSKYRVKVVEESQDLKVDSIEPNDIIISYSLHQDCIPQYNLGYQELKSKVLDILEKEHYKLSFGGTVFAEGVGVPDCVSNSFADAVKLM